MKWPILRHSAGGKISRVEQGVKIPVRRAEPYLYAPLDGRLVAPRRAFTDPLLQALRDPILETVLPPPLAGVKVFHLFAGNNFLGEEGDEELEWIVPVGEDVEEGEPIAKVLSDTLYWEIDLPETEESLSPLDLGSTLGASWPDQVVGPVTSITAKRKGGGALLAVLAVGIVGGTLVYLAYQGR